MLAVGRAEGVEMVEEERMSDEMLEGRVVEVERMSDARVERVDDRPGSVEDAMDRSDEDGEETTGLVGTDELEPAIDGVAEALIAELMLNMMDDTTELMLDSSALLVRVVTGTNDELTLTTEVMTDDEAGLVGCADVVLGVVGRLEVELELGRELVGVTTRPLLVDVAVAPFTTTVVGSVTFAADTVTVVLPWTVEVTVLAGSEDDKHEHAADTAWTARLILAADAKKAKSRRARSSRMERSPSSWTSSLRLWRTSRFPGTTTVVVWVLSVT